MFTRLLLPFLALLTSVAPLLAQWEWVDSSEGSSNFSRVTDIAVDSVRDDVYSVGFVTGNPNFPEIPNGSYNGGDDGFVIKYNLAGVIEWGFLIGGTSNDRINGVTVDQTTGNIFVTGFIEGTFATNSTSLEGITGGSPLYNVTGALGSQDAFVACYNVFGNLIWKKIIGGTNVDGGMDIDINADGVYVTGFYSNTATLSSVPSIIPNSGEINNFVIALDRNNGNTLWDAVLGSPGNDYVIPTNLRIRRTGISADENGVYLVTYFGGTIYRVYDAFDVLATTLVDPNASDEDYVVTSYTNSGNHSWSVLYDNDGSTVGTLDITNDCDGVYVSGALHNNGVSPGGTIIASNHDNFLLSKLNKATGSELWLKEFQSSYDHDDYFVGIDADSYGNIYAVGRLRGTSVSLGADLNYSAGATNSEVMIAHFLSDGSFQSFEVIPSSTYSWGMSIATYKNEKYIVGGYYNNTITFGSITPNVASNNAFIATRDLGDPLTYTSSGGNNIFCQSETNPIPISNLPVGGTFSGPPQVVFTNTSTGEIDLASSIPGGNYTISYTGYPSTCATTVAEFQIYILADPDPTFEYGTSHFCNDAVNPTPTSVTTSGGTFTGSVGLVVSSAGEIDLVSSVVGGPYDLTYTTGGVNCVTTSTIQVYVDDLPDPSFGYGASAYCSGTGSIGPSFITIVGGVFSAPAGIVFADITNGIIDLNSSTAGGPYSIKYLVSNGTCQDSVTFDVTIDSPADASFTYTTNYLCVNGPNVLPASTNNPGVFSTTSPLNISNASTGEIGASISPVGGPYRIYYTVNIGSCPGTDSLDLYIEAAPDPSFTYAQTEYCDSIGSILPNTLVDPTGTFSGPAGIFFTNTMTGEIDIDASIVGGPYIIKHVVSNAYCQDSTTFSLTINPLDDPSFSYAGVHFCNNEPNPLATVTGGPGTFSGPIGLDVNSSSGLIDVTTSTAGGPYYVVYTTSGSCPSSDSVQVYIEAAPDPSFTYAQTEYCDSIGSILPNTLVDPTGTFSGPAGIFFTNTMTGEIDIDASIVGGPYIIKHVVSNAYCQDSTTFSLTINPLDDPSFSYAGVHFCNNEPNPLATVTGDPGTFSGPIGLDVNSSSGLIDISMSVVGGPYYVIFTTNGPTCPNIDSAKVYIEAAPAPSFTYAQTEYCDSIGSILPNTLVDPTGTFSGPAGIFFTNTMTGEIDIDASIVGGPYIIKHVVSNAYCQDSTTFSLTINPLDDPSFSYAGVHFCNNEPNPVATITGDPGIFSGPIGLDVNSSSGLIDISMSVVGGPYYAVYTTNGLTCPSSDSVQIYIEAAPDPSFTYSQVAYCDGVGLVPPSSPATITGEFSAPAGSVFVNSVTGKIDIDGSPIGGPYTIQYLVSNVYCQDSATFDISIIGQDNLVSVEYSTSEYCVSDGIETPTIDGLSGGTFSGPISIDFVNPTTGEFSPSTSTPGGPYSVQYLTSGTCPDSLELFLTIYDTPSAYAGEDQELFFTFNSSLDADFPTVGNGIWTTLSDSIVADEFDPISDVSNLSLRNNKFLWTVSNGVCQKATDEIIILVQDLFIPQALTPNDDGKNDFFELHSIDEVVCSVQIFNRWGQVVYENNDYQNEWFGQNASGEQLENDTYFYVILINDSISYNGYLVLKK